MTSAIDTVIFDLGNVLIEWDLKNLYRKLIPDPDALDEFIATVVTMADNEKLDSGVPIAEVAEGIAARHPDKHDLVMAAVVGFAQHQIDPPLIVLCRGQHKGEGGV